MHAKSILRHLRAVIRHFQRCFTYNNFRERQNRRVVGDSGRKFASRYRSLNLRLAGERRKVFMAMFHFRIKSDKKPNGAKVSAVKHMEYIKREGTFAHDEHWKQTNKFVGNFITIAQTVRLVQRRKDVALEKLSELIIQRVEWRGNAPKTLFLILRRAVNRQKFGEGGFQ